MKQVLRVFALVWLVIAGQAAAAPFAYADLIGTWHVDSLRLADDRGVQALVADDPQYVGAVVAFRPDGITWLKGTPTRPIDAAIDDCAQRPKASWSDSVDPNDGSRAEGGGLTITCGVGGWGPSSGAVVRPIAGGRIELHWFDNGVLTLSRIK